MASGPFDIPKEQHFDMSSFESIKEQHFDMSAFESAKEQQLNFSSFESRENQNFNLSAYETHKSKEFTLDGDVKVRCAYVCDKKKVHKGKKIGDALSFYKNSCDYEFK